MDVVKRTNMRVKGKTAEVFDENSQPASSQRLTHSELDLLEAKEWPVRRARAPREKKRSTGNPSPQGLH